MPDYVPKALAKFKNTKPHLPQHAKHVCFILRSKM